MDASSYKRRRQYDENDEDKSLGEETEAEKYRDCEKFAFECSNTECSTDIVFENFFKDTVSLCLPFAMNVSEVSEVVCFYNFGEFLFAGFGCILELLKVSFL